MPLWVGVDASTKRDSTALVAVTLDKKTQIVKLVGHRVFTPSPGDPINFEQTVEATLLDWRKRYFLRQVYFDPFQLVPSRSVSPRRMCRWPSTRKRSRL